MAVKLRLQNKIINGAMDYWQRNTTFSVAAGTNSTYTADRFALAKAGTFTGTVARSSDVPATSAGLYSLSFTTGTAQATLGASDYLLLQQKIEGNVLRSFKSKKMVASFWVKASIAGSYSLSINNSPSTRSFFRKFSVSQANTWEKKTLRFQHNISGAWEYGQGSGMFFQFCLGSGSSFQNSKDTWLDGNFFTDSNQPNIAGTAGATFQVTDIVFVEDNDGESRDIDYMYSGRDFFDELRMCQRYYEVVASLGAWGFNNTSNTFIYRAPKRVLPSVNFLNVSNSNSNGAQMVWQSTDGIVVQSSTPSSGITSSSFTLTADAEL